MVALALAVPIWSQVRLYQDPTHKSFQRYMLVSNPLLIVTQLISVFIVGGYFG